MSVFQINDQNYGTSVFYQHSVSSMNQECIIKCFGHKGS